jgi:glucokinase
MNLYIDMGGTYLRYQIENQKIITLKERNIISFIKKILKSNPKINRVGISFAGMVRDNIILSAPNIDIKNLDLNNFFKNIEFKIDNDLNLAVLAESRYWKSKNIIALYIGTGIGAGIVSNGEIIRGALNSAGEIGHIPFQKAPFECGCGKDNCLELFCSGSAIKKWATYLNQNFSKLDELPKEIYNNFIEALLYGTSILITLFNPEILVLGGGVVENNPFLIKYIKKNILKYALNTNIKKLKIIQTQLENAPLLGTKYMLESNML